LTTNQIPEIFTPTKAIQSQMQIPIESREIDEEGLRCRQSAKRIVRRKKCSQCLTCKHLSRSKEPSHFHFQDEHPEEDSRQVKFPRIRLHRETTYAKCKCFHVYNLIKLSCSNDRCEACLLDLMYSKEVEASDHL